jgi:uncharacterized membrane protein
MFVFLIDRLSKGLRPISIITAVATEGRAVILGIYPRRLTEQSTPSECAAAALPDGPTRVIEHRGPAGVLLAFDVRGLVDMARRADCVIELVPQVGDFVAEDDPLFRVRGGRQPLDEAALGQSVAVGPERTLEQDPAFAFRIIVDVAAKALSPAINDPTTAVLALDQIHHLLRQVGSRHLDDGQVRDEAGRLRLVYRTPNWEDFVCLAVTEIRHFGGASIQVARRLRAMLENLIQTLPPARAQLLRQELTLLQRGVERAFSDPVDRARADIGDFQGVGGSRQGDGAPARAAPPV